ncbi:ketopantoate reductase family protein [Ottowia thiooxydans]|uniref:ketopantoate reductase family protein n=1 Tax=Ottowia thiooxydans TaxID=219182 RepID=UPI00040591AB|nr:2-dehydropantoate 2-reductase [Ottowia thiooxydans]
MKIAVMGCGAMGSVYAGLLASAGNELQVIDRWQEHVQTIRDQGLRVEGASGDRTVRMAAATEVPHEPMDLVIIATKASQTAQAARDARAMLAPHTVVLTIQNGLGSADLVAEEVGADRLLVGVAAAFGASLRGPAHARHEGMAAVRMGAYAGLPFAQADGVAKVWRSAGFNAEAVADVLAMQWEKLICNVAYSAPCALTGMTVGQVMDDPGIGPVSRAAAVEAWHVARACGVAIQVEDAVAHVRAFGARVADAKPSVLLDHEKRRHSEIDVINGAIPRQAARAGQEAPVNATLTALVKQRERDF